MSGRTTSDLTLSEIVKHCDELFDGVTVQKIGTPSRDEPHKSEVEKLNRLGYGQGAFWRLVK